MVGIAINSTQNKKIVGKAIDELQLNPLEDEIPLRVVPLIQPTFDLQLNKTKIVREGSVATTNASTTLITTPTDKDFYLTYLFIDYIKNATADGASSATLGPRIVTTIGGVSRQLLRTVNLTLTAQNGRIAVSFPKPIKIDRGVAISLSNYTFTVGAALASASIAGYEDDIGMPATSV